MDSALEKRQATLGDNDDNYVDVGEIYFSPIALLKWLVVGGIILLFIIWLIGGSLHARRRAKKGLKPLGYHRFLLPRNQQAKLEPQNNFSFYGQDSQGYRMDNHGPPPPVYNPEHPNPPNHLHPQDVARTDRSEYWNASLSGIPPRGIVVDAAGAQSGPKLSR